MGIKNTKRVDKTQNEWYHYYSSCAKERVKAMPKTVKWGIVIAGCMLVLFLAGYLFRDKISEYVRSWSWAVDSTRQAPGEGTAPRGGEAENPFD